MTKLLAINGYHLLAINGYPINIPQVLAYIPYMDPMGYDELEQP